MTNMTWEQFNYTVTDEEWDQRVTGIAQLTHLTRWCRNNTYGILSKKQYDEMITWACEQFGISIKFNSEQEKLDWLFKEDFRIHDGMKDKNGTLRYIWFELIDQDGWKRMMPVWRGDKIFDTLLDLVRLGARVNQWRIQIYHCEEALRSFGIDPENVK